MAVLNVVRLFACSATPSVDAVVVAVLQTSTAIKG